eukprot:m.193202 g.193202  ORF g.193202 m.193202 type:complete len:57 (+) comp53681_c0_seq6:497-667(+)
MIVVSAPTSSNARAESSCWKYDAYINGVQLPRSPALKSTSCCKNQSRFFVLPVRAA